jgi:hypothetical protein
MTFLCGAGFIGRPSREIFTAGLGAFARAASPGMTVECEPHKPQGPTQIYPFCPSFAQGGWGARFRPGWVIAKRRGSGVGVSKRDGLPSIKLPTLRFRAKIMLGFVVVLAISAASMGFAYLGFERVSTGVASYRKSVTEADLARNIDRELISYRSLARYYVVTGKEEDGKAALAAEASLKEAIDQSMRGTINPARLEQVTKLARTLSTESTRLREELDRFMANIRAA